MFIPIGHNRKENVINTQQKIIKNKLGLLNLAETLGKSESQMN